MFEKRNGAELIERTNKADQRKAQAAAAAAAAAAAGGGWCSILGAYARPSAEKVQAWRRVEALAASLDGYNLRITAANTFTFSAIFRFRVDGREALAWITAGRDRFAWAA